MTVLGETQGDGATDTGSSASYQGMKNDRSGGHKVK